MANLPIPILSLGMRAAVGGRVAEKLKPEYETIHFMTSIAQAKTDIPQVQAGKNPSSALESFVTGNFSKPPQAIVFGRVYEEAEIEELRRQCGGRESGMAWVMSSSEGREEGLRTFPYGGDQKAFDEYADRTTAITKKVLEGLREEGKLGKDGLFYY